MNYSTGCRLRAEPIDNSCTIACSSHQVSAHTCVCPQHLRRPSTSNTNSTVSVSHHQTSYRQPFIFLCRTGFRSLLPNGLALKYCSALNIKYTVWYSVRSLSSLLLIFHILSRNRLKGNFRVHAIFFIMIDVTSMAATTGNTLLYKGRIVSEKDTRLSLCSAWILASMPLESFIWWRSKISETESVDVF